MNEYEQRTAQYQKQYEKGEIGGNELDVLLDQLHAEYHNE